MARSLSVPAVAKTSARASTQPVMAYLCECGTKWTGSDKGKWACRCGRQLLKKNGVIHAAIPKTADARVVGLPAA